MEAIAATMCSNVNPHLRYQVLPDLGNDVFAAHRPTTSANAGDLPPIADNAGSCVVLPPPLTATALPTLRTPASSNAGDPTVTADDALLPTITDRPPVTADALLPTITALPPATTANTGDLPTLTAVNAGGYVLLPPTATTLPPVRRSTPATSANAGDPTLTAVNANLPPTATDDLQNTIAQLKMVHERRRLLRKEELELELELEARREALLGKKQATLNEQVQLEKQLRMLLLKKRLEKEESESGKFYII